MPEIEFLNFPSKQIGRAYHYMDSYSTDLWVSMVLKFPNCNALRAVVERNRMCPLWSHTVPVMVTHSSRHQMLQGGGSLHTGHNPSPKCSLGQVILQFLTPKSPKALGTVVVTMSFASCIKC